MPENTFLSHSHFSLSYNRITEYNPLLSSGFIVMVRPSRIARTARRAHQRQQETLRKQGLPTCEGCNVCSETEVREIKTTRISSSPASQQDTKLLPRKVRSRNLKNKVFKGDVFIADRYVVLAGAANESICGAEEGRFVYWSDASLRDDFCCGIGVAYRILTPAWTEISWGIRGDIGTPVLEAYAISKALEIAWEHCRTMEVERRPSCVCVYSDCKGALEHFSKFRKTVAGLKTFLHGEELIGPGVLAADG
jgi:hypothetical protein